ncbi:MAG: hypothetical protein EXR62_00300 [Chloroflexi bacterium]|nr:hypothetical protein [Chloroflexota bacterium]
MVILRGELDNSTSMPLQIAIPFPAGAEVIATAYASPTGDLFQTPYQQTTNGEWQIISWTIPVAIFHLEYYLNIVPKDTDQIKEFNFEIKLPYAAEQVELDVKQPLGATNFTMSPAPLKWASDVNGQQTTAYVFNQIPVNETRTVHIRYTRSINTPSFPKGQPAPQTLPPTRPTWPLYLASLLGLMGVGMLTYGLYQQRKNKSQQIYIGTHRKAKGKPGAEQLSHRKNLDRKAALCQVCGASLSREINFCPRCGEPAPNAIRQKVNSTSRSSTLLYQRLRQHPFWLAIGLLVIALIVSLGWWFGRTLPAIVSSYLGNWL